MDTKTKELMEELDYIEDLTHPYGWELKAHHPGVSFEDSDSNYFSLDTVAWKAVKEVLEDNEDLTNLFDLHVKREKPYIKRWQKALNKPDTMPDYGDFLKFLLDELEKK